MDVRLDRLMCIRSVRLQIMNYLFSFLESDRPHGTLLAGYFSKVNSDLQQQKHFPDGGEWRAGFLGSWRTES